MNKSAWFGDHEFQIHFPSEWKVSVNDNKSAEANVLNDNEIMSAFMNPIGSQTIKKLAEGKSEAIIIFDDLSRPTPVKQIVPFVLRELKEGGIDEDHIRFVAALGAHGFMTRHGFAEKLGEDILARFEIFNHNAFQHLDRLGETSRNTPVFINQEVMSCDLKIGIGSINPHRLATFGGGAKIIMPGVSGIETIYSHHGLLVGLANKKINPTMGFGLNRVNTNEARADIEEVARIAQLDIKIDALVNPHREMVGLYVGDFVAEHRKGCELAAHLYETPLTTECDIVVANSYPVDDEAMKVTSVINGSLKEGGDVVLITNSPEGQMSLRHYISCRFGRNYDKCLYSNGDIYPKAKRLFILSDYPSRNDSDEFGPREKVISTKSWDEILKELTNTYGSNAKVAVYPHCLEYPKNSS